MTDDLIFRLQHLIDNTPPKQLISSLRKHTEIYNYVMNNTQFLPSSIKVTERIYNILNPKIKSSCPLGNKKVFSTLSLGYKKFCGTRANCKCSRDNHSKKMKIKWDIMDVQTKKKRTDKSIRNLNTTKIKEKIKNTNLERYGVEKPFQSDKIRNKAKQTYKNKTGFNTPFENKEVIDNILQEQQFKYGGLMISAREALYTKYNGNPFGNTEIQKKIKKTNVERYGVPYPMMNIDLIEDRRKKYNKQYGFNNSSQSHWGIDLWNIISDPIQMKNICEGKTPSEIHDTIPIDKKTIISYAKKYNINIVIKKRSQYEEEIVEFLALHNIINYERNNRSVLQNKKELDFYFKDRNIAIEFNGLYWHSEINGLKDRNYHYNKMQKCKSLGIQLITIFEDEWINKKNIIKRKLLYMLKPIKSSFGARNIIIKEINNFQEEKIFLEQYHIQGCIYERQITYGAYNKSQLVGVLSVGKSKQGLYEIKRFATKQPIPGLFSKMFKHYITVNNISKVITFADLRYSYGDLYYKTGYILEKELKPSYFWTDFQTRYNRTRFRKDKISKKFSIDIKNKTETELMIGLGYDRIWDCGKLKFVWTRDI